jgi:hypothetical protein
MAVSPTSGEEASIARSVSKHCSPDGHCASSGTTKQTTPAAVVGIAKQGQGSEQVTVSAYAAPRFHEDYYGASGQEPNHH